MSQQDNRFLDFQMLNHSPYLPRGNNFLGIRLKKLFQEVDPSGIRTMDSLGQIISQAYPVQNINF